MSYELNKELIKKLGENSRKKILTIIGETGASFAAMNTHPHIDTGASVNAKQYTWTHPEQITSFKSLSDVKKVTGSAKLSNDTVYIIAPMEYDVYLERPYGIMARTDHQLRSYIKGLTE